MERASLSSQQLSTRTRTYAVRTVRCITFVSAVVQHRPEARFVDEVVAARAYDTYILTKKLSKPLNFPNDPAAEGHVVILLKKTSQYRGVSWSKRDKKWEVKIWVDGRTKRIASFDDENVAAHAYDAYAIVNRINTRRNFPDEDEDEMVAEAACVRAAPRKRKQYAPPNKSSRFRGVCWHKKEKIWQVAIKVDGKTKSLGRFSDEEKAGRKFDKYVVDNNLDRPLNFPVAAEEEDRESSLEGDKEKSSSFGGGSATARGGERKRSRAEEERRATRMTSDLADPRWKKIRVRRASSGRRKWVVVQRKSGQAASASASLVLSVDGEERTGRGIVAVQARSSASAKTSERPAVARQSIEE